MRGTSSAAAGLALAAVAWGLGGCGLSSHRD